MSASRNPTTTKVLVPMSAESRTSTRNGRVRLSKLLAAKPAGKRLGNAEAVPAKKGNGKGKKAVAATLKKAKKPSNRYKLPDKEYAELTALRNHLLTLGVRIKKSDLLRAGLALLLALKDPRLKKAVTQMGGTIAVPPPRNVPEGGLARAA